MYLSLKVPEDSPRAPIKLVNVEVIAELMSWGDQSLKGAGYSAGTLARLEPNIIFGNTL